MPSRTLAELAEVAGASLQGDGTCVISGVETLQSATSGQITFLTNPRYRRYLSSTSASAVVLAPEDLDECNTNALVSDNPYLAYARISACFTINAELTPGIHPDATVHPEATIAESARVDAGAVIGSGAVIGENAVVGVNCVVGADVVIGARSHLVAGVVLLDRVQLGADCLLHPGVVVGSDGFGLASDNGRWVKVCQLGRVIIEDEVEIGANTTVDRGAIHDTIIRKGAKLDNQIQVAHNVEIGENTAIAACTGIAGSTRIGSGCTLAGGVGIVGHIELADGVHISAMSLVSRSLREPGIYTGSLLAMPHKTWQKNLSRVKQLDTMARQIRKLEEQIEQLNADLADKQK